MKFLLLASHPDSLVNFRGKLIQAIVNKGLSVHVVGPMTLARNETITQLESYGAIVHNLDLARAGIAPFSDMKYFMGLIKIMGTVKPDILLSYAIKPVVYGSIAGWVSRVPNRFALVTGLGFAFHDSEGLGNKIARFIAKLLYRLSLRKNDNVFFQNEDDQKLFYELGILPKSQPSLVVNGSGVDLTHFENSDLPDGNRFLLISRLIEHKGIREFADAAKIIKQKYPTTKFVLVGGFDDNPHALDKNEVAEWESQGLLECTGSLADVRPEIARCSVYVLPSYREGTPRTVLEAMSMGRAVVTTDAPGCRNTVIEGETGYLVPVQDHVSLANALEKFILDSTLAQRFGLRAREYAEQKYDVIQVNSVMMSEMGIE